MATEMAKVIERTRTETMSNMQKLIDEAEDDEDVALDPADVSFSSRREIEGRVTHKKKTQGVRCNQHFTSPPLISVANSN